MNVRNVTFALGMLVNDGTSIYGQRKCYCPYSGEYVNKFAENWPLNVIISLTVSWFS